MKYNRQDLIDKLVVSEGLRLQVYKDTLGIDTIGIGRNLEDRGITKEELDDLDIPSKSIQVIKQIKEISNKFDFNESKYNLNTKTDWNIYLEFVQPAYMWIQNKSIYEIKSYCQYEGNFIKNIIKINNILENIKSICMIIEDYDLLYKIQDLYKILIRDQVTLESLYI